MATLPLAAANSQAIDGFYVGGGAGINFLQDEKPKLISPRGSTNGHSSSDVGPAFVLSLGWGFGNGLRTELEGNYRENGLHNPGGQEQKAGAMANVFYDFVGMVPVVQPYIGVGAGYQWAIEQNLHGRGPGFTFAAPADSRGGFAYQAIAGMAIPISSVPGLAVTAEYRFLGLTGDRSYGAVVSPAVGPAVHGSLTSTADFNHSILVGFRYAFGAAPSAAAAPLPVADMGAKTFLVFFDWDKYNLTARSARIVNDAANYSSHAQYTRIDVDGNTDTSGTPGYNQSLSQRRAHAVANELVRDGVPAPAISLHAFGDTKLLVPTAPGVREPQNRRVEIVFH